MIHWGFAFLLKRRHMSGAAFLPSLTRSQRVLGTGFFLALSLQLVPMTEAQTLQRGQGQSPTISQPGQTGGQPSSRSTPAITSPQQIPGAAKVSAGPSALSLEQAIKLAIENNLATLLAKERRNEARGFAKEARAGLLPNISGAAYQASVTENLAALGFTPGRFPGFTSTFIGPFKNFDARVRLEQTIFSLSALRTFQAGRAGVRVAEMEEDLAREQVATFASLAYLESMRADRAVSAAQANVTLAQTLLKLAQDQRDAGIATGVDLTRAETRLAQEQVRLSRAQTDAEQGRLQLQRIVGLPLGSPLTLTDPLSFVIETLPAIETAVAQAEDTRAEVRVAQAQVTETVYQRRAARAEQLPSLEFLGDYGVSGITPTNSDLPTRRAAVQLNVPIFNGGLTRGRIQVASSRANEAELQLASVRGQVEEDVRLAFSGLRTTAETVRAADLAVTLAERELEMARDRFRAGVADSIEVVTAQTVLANARLDQVSALAVYNGARLNLAAALGRAQTFRW
ncbi:MAG TPA: TolC family protein [Pyrinomonadaceae bacterium]|nr:TolC family protein [Pyrinomonadaceae bacterium]